MSLWRLELSKIMVRDFFVALRIQEMIRSSARLADETHKIFYSSEPLRSTLSDVCQYLFESKRAAVVEVGELRTRPIFAVEDRV